MWLELKPSTQAPSSRSTASLSSGSPAVSRESPTLKPRGGSQARLGWQGGSLALPPRGCLYWPPASRSSACEAINGSRIQVLLIQWCLPKCCFLRAVGCPTCLPSESVFFFPTHSFLFLEVGHGRKPVESEPESVPTPF